MKLTENSSYRFYGIFVPFSKSSNRQIAILIVKVRKRSVQPKSFMKP